MFYVASHEWCLEQFDELLIQDTILSACKEALLVKDGREGF